MMSIYPHKPLVAPSLLSADFSILKQEIQALEKAGADRLHIDVMDGHFVPNISFGTPIIKSIKKVTSLCLDVHLMTVTPEKFIPLFIETGAHSLSFHREAIKNPVPALKEIRKYNVLAGLSIKPKTDVSCIFPFLDYLDLILIMTVEPGFGGQSFLPDQAQKVIEIKKELQKQNKKDIMIHVDGGINSRTCRLVDKADVLVSGNFIFQHKNYQEAISKLKGMFKNEIKK